MEKRKKPEKKISSNKSKRRLAIKARISSKPKISRKLKVAESRIKTPRPSPALRPVEPPKEEIKPNIALPPPERFREFTIPLGYGDNRIVLMVRDPWWLYAYWEIQRPKEEEIRNTIKLKGFDNPKSILRIYDVTDIDFNGSNAHGFFDIELKGLANNWYIEVRKPNCSWMADIGLLTPSGDFFLLARSNCVRTPRFGMSEVTDEEWFCPAEDYWKMFGVAGGGKLGQSSIGAVSSLFSPMGAEKRKKPSPP